MKRVSLLTVVHYNLHGYHLSDCEVFYFCPKCKELQRRLYRNVTLTSARRAAWACGYVYFTGPRDAFIRLRKDGYGCYAPEGVWLDHPRSTDEALSTWKAKPVPENARYGDRWGYYATPEVLDDPGGQMTKPKKENVTLKVALAFVTEHLGRAWTPADYSGSHMKHASLLLKAGLEASDILGCLQALKEGVLEWDFPVEYLSTLTKGEPPLIERWYAYRDTPPPIYEEMTYNRWLRLTGKEPSVHQETAQREDPGVSLPPGYLWSA